MKLRNDCDQIVRQAIAAVQPDAAVRRALKDIPLPQGRLVLVSVGKAAWSMARAAYDCVGDKLSGGIVITKHGHAQGPIGQLLIREAGHPVPDQDTFSVDILVNGSLHHVQVGLGPDILAGLGLFHIDVVPLLPVVAQIGVGQVTAVHIPVKVVAHGSIVLAVQLIGQGEG